MRNYDHTSPSAPWFCSVDDSDAVWQYWHLPVESYSYGPSLDRRVACRYTTRMRLVSARHARAYLPIYTALAVALMGAGLQSVTIDHLAIAILAARICQTLTHISTNATTALRFAFFFAQAGCLRGKRTWLIAARMSGNDPKRTLFSRQEASTFDLNPHEIHEVSRFEEVLPPGRDSSLVCI
jgi:hypothetical protein